MTIISPTQVRMARALFNMSQEALAAATGIKRITIFRLENGVVKARDETLHALSNYFESRGIEFTEFDGVRRSPQDIEVFIGPERFHDFTDFVYQYLVEHGGDVCISADDETQFQKYRKDVDLHRKRMQELVDRGDVTVRILASESSFIPLFSQMKWQPRQSSTPTSFYAFGNCLALISFDHDPAPYVALHKSGPFADAYRQSFEIAWANAKDPAERPMS